METWLSARSTSPCLVNDRFTAFLSRFPQIFTNDPCLVVSLFTDVTPPKLSCPQSYVIELIDKQESYSVNFNETRRRINATDVSGPVKITFVPERALIPVGGFENVTVYATDASGNRASCHFQVSVQATPCVDWELKPPANGGLKCVNGDKGLQCIATCKNGYRFTDGAPVKTFTCDVVKHWSPSSVVPDCVSESGYLFHFQSRFKVGSAWRRA